MGFLERPLNLIKRFLPTELNTTLDERIRNSLQSYQQELENDYRFKNFVEKYGKLSGEAYFLAQSPKTAKYAPERRIVIDILQDRINKAKEELVDASNQALIMSSITLMADYISGRIPKKRLYDPFDF